MKYYKFYSDLTGNTALFRRQGSKIERLLSKEWQTYHSITFEDLFIWARELGYKEIPLTDADRLELTASTPAVNKELK